MAEQLVSSSSSADPPIPATKFDEPVLLEPKQFSAYWEKFPYPMRKAVNRTKRGELKPVSDDDLFHILVKYLTGASDGERGVGEAGERTEPASTSEFIDEKCDDS